MTDEILKIKKEMTNNAKVCQKVQHIIQQNQEQMQAGKRVCLNKMCAEIE